MTDETTSQEFRLDEIDEKLNYFVDEVKQNKLINKKHKKRCNILNDNENLLILASTVTGYVSISAFVPLIGMLVGIAISAVTEKFVKNMIKRSY